LARGEVLAFSVDEALRPADLLGEQRLDFLDAGIVLVFGPSAGDAYLDVLEVRFETVGPCARLRRLHWPEWLVAGAPPAIAGELVERTGGRAFDHHRHVVPRAVAPPAETPAAGIVLEVLARVPALVGHVDSAAHGELVVDHRYLLVMAAADRMRTVELEVDAPAPQPAQEVEHHCPARGNLERADAPLEDAHLERAAVAGEPGNKAAEPRRMLALPSLLPPAAAVRQVDAGVEVPADQQDALARLEHRLLHQVEVLLGVDDHADPRGHRVAPDARLHGAVVERAVRLRCRVRLAPHPALVLGVFELFGRHFGFGAL